MAQRGGWAVLAGLACLGLPAAGGLEATLTVANLAPSFVDGGWTRLPTSGLLFWAQASDANGGEDVEAAVFLLEGPGGVRELPAGRARTEGEHAWFEALLDPILGPIGEVRVRFTDASGASTEVPLPGSPPLQAAPGGGGDAPPASAAPASGASGALSPSTERSPSTGSGSGKAPGIAGAPSAETRPDTAPPQEGSLPNPPQPRGGDPFLDAWLTSFLAPERLVPEGPAVASPSGRQEAPEGLRAAHPPPGPEARSVLGPTGPSALVASFAPAIEAGRAERIAGPSLGADAGGAPVRGNPAGSTPLDAPTPALAPLLLAAGVLAWALRRQRKT